MVKLQALGDPGENGHWVGLLLKLHRGRECQGPSAAAGAAKQRQKLVPDAHGRQEGEKEKK
jgi:hypothetical protein